MKKLKLIVSLIILTFFSLFALFPIGYIFAVSFKNNNSFQLSSFQIWTDSSSFDNYIKLFTETQFPTWLINSLVVSTSVTLFGITLAAFAAYALSRFPLRGGPTFLLVLLSTQMLPATMLLLPFYLLLSKFGLANHYLGLLIIYSSTALPFCIWQLKAWFDSIPKSLEEAAQVDGSTRLQAFFKVILPISGPALAVTSLFQFMTAWSEYAIAAIILQDSELFTLPVGLKSFQASLATEWGLYAAAAVLVSIPAVLLFTLLSKALISGLTMGSVKG